MIVGLRGTIERIGHDWMILQVNNISIRVNIPASILSDCGSVGEHTSLFTHLVVREEGLSLYGFTTGEGQRLFELLLGVSGIGPRHALGLLSTMNPETLAGAISHGDTDALSRVPGVGKKTANRLVLELKDSVAKEFDSRMLPDLPIGFDQELVAALTSLGYSSSEARKSIAEIGDVRSASLEDRIRLALKQMVKG